VTTHDDINNFESFGTLSERLEDVAPENGHFRAMCPAHAGHRPALTMMVEGEPPNRKILLHCHAGCGLQEILDAVGFKKSGLFERSASAGKKKLGPIFKTYDY